MSYVISDLLQSMAARAQETLKIPEAPALEPANPKFGADYALPCFGLARELRKNPAEIAGQLAGELQTVPGVAKAEAVSGFVNIWLSDEVLTGAIAQVTELGETFGSQETYKNKQVVIESAAPNPFKEFHVGHLYNITVGDTLGRLYRLAGADVHQVSYHGDVGMHIAMAVWGIQGLLQEGDTEWFDSPDNSPKTMTDVIAEKRIAFMGAGYARGAKAFAEDESAKKAITTINKHIYEHDEQDIQDIYQTGCAWSFAYFEGIYQQLHTAFERRYLESEVSELGTELVRQYTGTVFELSDGAVVFKGEQANLHTRVFINSEGLPTYEAKEIGLIFSKQRDYPEMAESVVVTANEIDEYFKVLMAATARIDVGLAQKMRHISHGILKLTTGKMSSRTGKVMRAVEVLDMVRDTIAQSYDTPAIDDTKQGAIRYAFLKQRVGGDIVFDVNESISLSGNSGPYIQYAHARGRSILAKLPQNAGGEGGRAEKTKSAAADTKKTVQPIDLTPDERALATKIIAYTAATDKAIAELAPHHICTYLYELTQQFNRFYEKNRIVDDPRQNQRAQLTRAYCQVLQNGLSLLNIPAPERL